MSEELPCISEDGKLAILLTLIGGQVESSLIAKTFILHEMLQSPSVASVITDILFTLSRHDAEGFSKPMH